MHGNPVPPHPIWQTGEPALRSTPAMPMDRPIFSAILLAMAGLSLSWWGGQLILLAGSPYYLLAGVALLASAYLLITRRTAGYWVYGMLLAATAAWAIYEVGSDFWGLVARLAAPLVLGAFISLAPLARHYGRSRVAGATLFIFALLVGSVLIATRDTAPVDAVDYAFATEGSDWTTYAGEIGASRHAALAQITPANIGALKPAWTYRTGDMPGPADAMTGWTFESTPLKVGNRLFLCTAHSQIHAVDADTGRRLWIYEPKAAFDWVPLRACRGVGYYQSPPRPDAPSSPCAERIIAPILDGRVVAVDAATGRPCPDFGKNGVIDLREGLGPVRPGYYHSTSGPLVIGDRFVIGANVLDGAEIGEPSGVIRAFDVRTGKLDWAWDLAATGDARQPYSRGTPNAWAPLTADPVMGLVYIPLGNPTPDFFGARRSAAMERYGSSLVALDIATGKPRWSFQTIHHDLWDQDLPAQPTLFELATPRGRVPALVQPTKRGELFVLDRRTGKPLAAVAERPAPRGAAAGDFTAPTQPYSTGMPSLLGPRLREASAWGITPIDQLLCRIRFRQLRYEGPLTPPSVGGSLSYPGSAGVVSWGGVSIDPRRDLLVVNSVHSPFVTRLIPRAAADRNGMSTPPNSVPTGGSRGSSEAKQVGAMAAMPQVGTPYAAQAVPFLSPLKIPCIAPPWGRITAIDLKKRRVVWEKPFGTSRDTGPLGLRTGLPLPIGVPSAGGPITTASGITFIAAAQDRYLRAFDTKTGAELWRGRLPAGAQATPMTYVSAASGRQFVVVAAGGHAGLNTAPGDYVVAFALPRRR